MTPAASDTPARPRCIAIMKAQRLELDAWGVVFCGGASRRMGRDKALLELDGRSLVARAAAALAEVAPRVLLASGSAPRYAELGLECVLDSTAGTGPLAGLAAALERVERERVPWLLALACDMPSVSGEVFRALHERARSERADACLVATRRAGSVADDVEPLLAVYSAAVLPAVRAALARGEHRLNAFHGDVRIARLALVELGPRFADCARNLNTPRDFLEAGGRLE